MKVPAQRWVMPLEQGRGRNWPPSLPHHPVGGSVVTLLDHQLHVPPARGAINKPAGPHLVEKRQGKIGLDHTGSLKLLVFVDAHQGLTGGEIIDQPGRTFISLERPLAPQRFDVTLYLALQPAIRCLTQLAGSQPAKSKSEKKNRALRQDLMICSHGSREYYRNP